MFDNTNKSKISKECFLLILCLLLGAVLLLQFINLVLMPKESSESYLVFFKVVLVQALITIPIALLIYPKHRSIPNLIFCVGLPQLVSVYIFGDNLLTSLICTLALVGLYLAIYFFPVFWERIRPRDPFENLSIEDRLLVLRKIVRIEKKYLGIELDLYLLPKSMLADTLASYCPATGTIELNKFNLSKERPHAIDLIRTVCHECIHAAQFQAILSANTAAVSKMSAEEKILLKIIRRNFIHYKSAEVDGKAYENQLIEKQARSYAKARIPYYKNKKRLKAIIASCLKKTPAPPNGKAHISKRIQNSRVA